MVVNKNVAPTSKERIRIMRMITRLEISGPSIHVCLLANRFDANEYETILVVGESLSDQDNMLFLAQEYNVDPIVVPAILYSTNPLHILHSIKVLSKLIREQKPDILHTHARTAGVLGRLAGKLAGVPVTVHTFHEYPFKGFYGQNLTRVFIFAERLVARFTDSIITLTESLRTDVVETYKITRRSRITVLPMGLDLEQFTTIPRHQNQFRSDWNIPADVPLIGLIGRMIPVKNHALFLESAKQVLATIPEAHFVLVGDGYLRSELEQQVRDLGIQDALIFTGWQQDVRPIYSDLDLLVISSINEGTPVPVIEALSASCPVIATDVGGIKDLLKGGEFGKLVPSENVETLANAMIDCIQNPPDPEPAKQRMIEQYGIEKLVRDMDSMYRGLLAMKNMKKRR